MQIAQHELKQYEASTGDGAMATQLQESLESVRRQHEAEVTTLQGRLSSAEEQVLPKPFAVKSHWTPGCLACLMRAPAVWLSAVQATAPVQFATAADMCCRYW